MGTKSNIVDLASHFPPSSNLGRAANTTSGERKNGGPSHFDGVVVFPREGGTLAHWRPRMVYQQRIGWDKTKYSTQCEVFGFAEMKGALRAQVTEPVFFETWRDGNAVVDTFFRLFDEEHASLNFTLDSSQRRGLSISTSTMRFFFPEHLSRDRVLAGVTTPPSLLAPYATVCLDVEESRRLKEGLLNHSHESSFSLMNGEIRLYGRTWNAAKAAGFGFGRHGGRNTVNALTMFEKFFEEIDIAEPAEPPALTPKQRKAQKKQEEIAASNEKARRMSLSMRDLALEDLKVLQKPIERLPYAVFSSRLLRSFVDDGCQFYVPSQNEADWFPSRVLSAVLDTRGLTTLHLRPRMIEVVKETPFAVYRYFICGKGIWDWYQEHQPARYFGGKFEYA
jgi:hypothetical protein